MDDYGRNLGAKQLQHKSFFPLCSEGFLPTSQVIGHYFWTINRYRFGKTLQPCWFPTATKKTALLWYPVSLLPQWGGQNSRKSWSKWSDSTRWLFAKEKRSGPDESCLLRMEVSPKCAVSGKNMIGLHKSFVICRCKQPCLLIHLK